MDRRSFLKGSAMLAGAMYLDLPTFADEVKNMGTPRLRIGILSDIHLKEEDTAGTFVHALEYFRDQQVDGVIIAGDMADWGFESQLKVVADSWYKVFPKDKLPSGEHVEKLFVYGNHDMEGYTYGGPTSKYSQEECKQQAIFWRKEKLWKKYFHENFSPIYLKTVKGYHFIGAHWADWKHIPGVAEFLEKNNDKLAGEKPFFYIQHAHPKNTVFGEWAWGQDNGEVTQALSQYPNAIAFSGHSHHPLNQEMDLWQGAFTSIGTSSLSYLYPLGGRENNYVDNVDLPYQMPIIGCKDGKQGMLMTIYDDYITLERREFVYDQILADNWVLPLHRGKETPLSFENRARAAKVPQFAKGDTISIRTLDGKSRAGEETKQVEASFPTVLKKRTGVRASDYEVTVEQQLCDVITVRCSKRVYSPGCYLGENQDEKPVTCLFALSEMPKNLRWRFVARPCEDFGKKGDPIYSDWQEKL